MYRLIAKVKDLIKNEQNDTFRLMCSKCVQSKPDGFADRLR